MQEITCRRVFYWARVQAKAWTGLLQGLNSNFPTSIPYLFIWMSIPNEVARNMGRVGAERIPGEHRTPG